MLTPPGAVLPWKDLLRKKGWLEIVMSYALIPPIAAVAAWVVWALADWLVWLHWPAVILAGFAIFVFAGVSVTALGMHVKRSDTATQTLRGASQGRIEIIGTLRLLEGMQVSPLYGIPCVAFKASFSARGDDGSELASLREKVYPPAVLLTDGGREAFLPITAADEDAMRIELERLDAPRDLLRADIREALGDGGTITHRLEEVVPSDKPMQINGVFRTLSSADSYLTVVNSHVDILPPADEELEKDAVEQAWRAYCRRREAEAGDTGPVSVDAILPVTLFKGIGIVRVADANWRHTADVVGVMVLLALPFTYLLLRLLGVIDPLPLLF